MPCCFCWFFLRGVSPGLGGFLSSPLGGLMLWELLWALQGRFFPEGLCLWLWSWALHPGSVQVRGRTPQPCGAPSPPRSSLRAPCFLSSSVVLESRFVSVLASQCFCQSKAALRHVWGPLPGSAHPAPEGPPPESLQPRARPAGPVPAAQPAQPPHGQPALTGHLLGLRDMPLSGILSFSAFGGCVYTFFTAFCL